MTLSMLNYAPQGEIRARRALSLPAPQPRPKKKMRALTQPLVDAALACGGNYYLPSRRHTTIAQFRLAYPAFAEFCED
jgi:hypothetical protein